MEMTITSKPREKSCKGCIFNDTDCYSLKIAKIVKELLGDCDKTKIIFIIKN